MNKAPIEYEKAVREHPNRSKVLLFFLERKQCYLNKCGIKFDNGLIYWDKEKNAPFANAKFLVHAETTHGLPNEFLRDDMQGQIDYYSSLDKQ